jgi:hypothetical protein
VHPIPRPRESDGERVLNSLREAEQAWQQDRVAEAVMWLRTAATNASLAGNRLRAAELYEAASSVAEATSDATALTPRVDRAAAAVAPVSAPAPSGPGSPPSSTGSLLEMEDRKRTNELPRSKLRRALMAIDPDYPRRVDYDPARAGVLARMARSASAMSPAIGYLDLAPSLVSLRRRAAAQSENDEPGWLAGEFEQAAALARAQAAELDTALDHGTQMPAGAVPAYTVNVLRVGREDEISVLFVPPGTPSRRGVAAGLLLPLSARDAERLARIYEQCNAKL